MALPKEALEDPFGPPDKVCVVQCLHCGKQFLSSLMVWRKHGEDWLWMCPTEGCDGGGFGFDIHPVPPVK